MKIKVSPSVILGVLCLALVLFLGQSEQCGQHCNTTNHTNNDFGLQLNQRPRPTPPRPTPGRPPPPRPRPPPPRPPPPRPRPPPPRPPPPRPPPPTPRPPPPRPPPPTPRPPPPRPPPPTPRPPPPRPPPPTPRPPPPRPPPPTPRPPPPRPPPPPPTPSPPPPPGTPTLAEIFPEQMFNNFIINFMDPNCPGRWFYNYHAFMTATESFPEFGNTGDVDTRKREIAAFFGQTSHETSGVASIVQPSAFNSAYCLIEEEFGHDWLRPDYCEPTDQWECVPWVQYFGRGPVQLRWNYNYGAAGEALNLDLLFNPDLVSHDPTISFETALWFWMTPQGNKPSSHDVMTGQWVPSFDDIVGSRLPGYGVVTNIFNGGVECGDYFNTEHHDLQHNRINFFKRYCDLLGVGYGSNIDCFLQRPFDDWNLVKNDNNRNQTQPAALKAAS